MESERDAEAVRDNISRGNARPDVRARLWAGTRRREERKGRRKKRKTSISWEDRALKAARLPIESFNASRLSIPRYFSPVSLDFVIGHAVITSSRPPEI